MVVLRMSTLLSGIISTVLLVFTINQWSSCRISNEPIEPIAVFSFPSSKFQVKDAIDSVVRVDSNFSFKKLTDYLDTFILEKSFSLARLDIHDSIKYYYYFSGDVKEWLTDSDSAFLVLSDVTINGKTYNSKLIKRQTLEEMKDVLRYFEQNIILKTSKYIEGKERYDIRMIDSVQTGKIKGKGVVCRELPKCDTLLLIYLDGGKYTGILRESNN